MRRLLAENISWRTPAVIGGCALVAALVLCVVWSTRQCAVHSRAIWQEFERLDAHNLADEKMQQEAVKLHIENDQRTLFLQNLLTNMAAIVGVLGVVSAAWLAADKYVATREEQRSRENAEWFGQVRSDVVKPESGDLDKAKLWVLQSFLTKDTQTYHGRFVRLLARLGREKERDKAAEQAVVSTFECAMSNMTLSTLRSTSWQYLRLEGPTFSNLNLSRVDFRDSILPGADFRRAKLKRARFDAAKLMKCRFEGANLSAANLHHADLTRANMAQANLRRADLTNINLDHMNLKKADLRGAHLSEDIVRWMFRVENWRSARFDRRIQRDLLREYGPAPSGPRVLMLMWELYPAVTGGGWTAAYHLIQNLCKQGANLTVAVPWPELESFRDELGYKVELLFTGAVAEDKAKSHVADAGYPRPVSVYDMPRVEGVYQAEGLQAAEAFTERARATVGEKKLKFDLIHAHDWMTFAAAESISRQLRVPWIAHIHSIDADRRPADQVDNVIATIEAEACRSAHRIVVASRFEKTRLVEAYGADEEKIIVVPNCLSKEVDPKRIGPDFSSKRVVFLGRLTWQKGADLFVQLARNVLAQVPQAQFAIFGTGDMESSLQEAVAGQPITFCKFLDWRNRETAFDGATAVVVPSRFEPFGMTALEALHAGVPLLYSKQCGVGEVVRSGIRIDPDNLEDMQQKLMHILTDQAAWQKTADEQSKELSRYHELHYERELSRIWEALAPRPPTWLQRLLRPRREPKVPNASSGAASRPSRS